MFEVLWVILVVGFLCVYVVDVGFTVQCVEFMNLFIVYVHCCCAFYVCFRVVQLSVRMVLVCCFPCVHVFAFRFGALRMKVYGVFQLLVFFACIRLVFGFRFSYEGV